MPLALYRNARVFTADPAQPWAEALVVADDRLVFVGDDARASAAAGPHADIVDLGGSLVVPGFIDAHTHLIGAGRALGQAQLTDARTIDEIIARLRAARDVEPDAPRLIGRGWLFDSVPGGSPTAAMLDEAFPDVPVYLDANDYHSCWLNTAALRESGVTRDSVDPAGGRVSRDADGEPNGLLYENAMVYSDAVIQAARTDADADAALARAFDEYLAAGVTGAIDMGLGPEGTGALRRVAARDGALPMRVAAHWLVSNEHDTAGNLAQVEHAAALRDEIATAHPGAQLEIVGIKLMLDGVIDACTAAMRHPYADGSNEAPMWTLDELTAVVTRADALGLTVAMHAIGDLASELAMDALEAAVAANGERDGRRHRIEHLEQVTPETIERMSRLGVTASMQPVHSDPAIQANWQAMLGDDRVARGYPWPEFTAAGALLAFGTDAPTAPHLALHNLYIASTRESALDASFPPNHPELAVPLPEALLHATRDAAISCGWGDDAGVLAAGRLADFAVIDADPFVDGAPALLTTRVIRTVVGGRVVYEAAPTR